LHNKDIFCSTATACIPGNQNYITAIEHYLAAGITHIELGSSHKYFSDNDVASLKNYPASFLLHNYFPPTPNDLVLNLASVDPDVQTQSKQLVKNAIELSASLNALFYSFHAGFINDPYGFGTTSYLFHPSKPGDKEKALTRFIFAVDELAIYAENLGVQLLVENNVCPPDLKGTLLLQTPFEFEEFFDRLSSKNIGILVDFGHLNVSAQTFGFNRLDFSDRLKNHIAAFHVHDNNGYEDLHQPVSADSWILSVLQSLEFIDLPKVIEAKFGDVEQLKTHAVWLRKTLTAN